MCLLVPPFPFRNDGIGSSGRGGREFLRRIRTKNLTNILREEDMLDPPKFGVRSNCYPVYGYFLGLGDVVPANHSHLLG